MTPFLLCYVTVAAARVFIMERNERDITTSALQRQLKKPSPCTIAANYSQIIQNQTYD